VEAELIAELLLPFPSGTLRRRLEDRVGDAKVGERLLVSLLPVLLRLGLMVATLDASRSTAT
jgi:hypothetical protein